MKEESTMSYNIQQKNQKMVDENEKGHVLGSSSNLTLRYTAQGEI